LYPKACLEWHDVFSRPRLNFTDGLHFYRMSLFSFLRKNKQESASDDSAFYSRAEEESKAVRSRAKRRQNGKSQDDDAVDPVLPEKKRARRRLIGAVALVLAAVVGLPMILDSEPKPVADDIAIQIPSKDKPVSSGNVRPPAASRIVASAGLDPAEEMIEPPVAAAESKAQNKAQTGNPDATGAAQAAPSNPKATQNVHPETEAVKATATGKPDRVASPAAKTEIKPDEKSRDAARAKALLEGKSAPKPAEKKPGKFVIQVAALATKEKVDELQNKLKSAGIKSYTQKVATTSGDRTRIRVGPFSSKEEAEKVRARIVKLGLTGTLAPV
jgi:DedD protein